jgi:hypothetical protein
MPFDAGRVLIVLVAAASFWQPARGVLLLAVLAPMSAVAAFRSSSPVQLADALALGFLAGWIVRRHRPVRGPAFPALAVSAMCALGLLALIQIRARVWSAGHALEGTALAFAAADLFRSRPNLAVRLPAAVAGGLLASALAAWATGLPVLAPAAPAMMACACAGTALRKPGSGAVFWRGPWAWAVASGASLIVAVLVAASARQRSPLLEHFGRIELVLVGSVVATLLWQVARGIVARPGDARLVGFATGLIAYVGVGALDGVTASDGCVGFWLMIGLTAGLAGSNLLGESGPARDAAASVHASCG